MPNNVNIRKNETQQFYENFDSADTQRKTTSKENKAASGVGQSLGGTAGSSVTVDNDTVTQQNYSNGSADAYDAVPPSAMTLSEAMLQIQSVQGKIQTNSSAASAANIKSAQSKQNDATVDYENQMNKAEADAAKAAKKAKKNEVLGFFEDAAEFIGGAVLAATAIIGDAPGAAVGCAMMVSAGLQATDQILVDTGTVKGKAAEDLGIATAVTCGVIGLACAGYGAVSAYSAITSTANAVSTAGDLTETGLNVAQDSVEMTNLASNTSSLVNTGSNLTEDAGSELGDLGDEANEAGDDPSSDDEEAKTQKAQKEARIRANLKLAARINGVVTGLTTAVVGSALNKSSFDSPTLEAAEIMGVDSS
ncbi:MAG: hypothetical protein AAFY56_21920, partial [Pseudomonadota bacterium]